MSHALCDPVIRILRARSMQRKIDRVIAESVDDGERRAYKFIRSVARSERCSAAEIMRPHGMRQKRARHAVARYLRLSLKWKYEAIAAFLDCDHSTIVGACREHKSNRRAA